VAARAAVVGPLTDDAMVGRGLEDLIDVYLGRPDGPTD
jgi:nitric oxide reductase NorQ protein